MSSDQRKEMERQLDGAPDFERLEIQALLEVADRLECVDRQLGCVAEEIEKAVAEIDERSH